MEPNGQSKSILIDEKTLSIHLKGMHKQNQTTQQMLKSALAHIEGVKQLELKMQNIEGDLRDLEPLPEILQRLSHLLKILQDLADSHNTLSDRLSQIETVAQQRSEPATNTQSLERQIQTLTQQLQEMRTEQRNALQKVDLHLNELHLDVIPLAERLSPIQVWLNGKQMGIKAITITLVSTVLAASALSGLIVMMGVNGSFTSMLERINSRVNNLDIQMTKVLKRLR